MNNDKIRHIKKKDTRNVTIFLCNKVKGESIYEKKKCKEIA